MFTSGGIALLLTLFVFFLVCLAVVASAVKIVPEHQRGVVFRLGRFLKVAGPGLVLLLPAVDMMIKVDIRETGLEVPRLQEMTRDRQPVSTSAVVRYRITAPDKAILNVEDYRKSLAEASALILDDVIAQHTLDDLFLEKRDVAALVQDIIQEQATPWGLEITAVELKDLRRA